MNFIDFALALKGIKRTGWVERGVKDAESIADHSFLTALLSMALADEIDENKAVKIALVHDLAESAVGDLITKENWPSGGTVTEKKKTALEKRAMKKIASSLPLAKQKEILDLWDEFALQKTREAVFVRDIDIAERLIQAKNYHDRKNYEKPLEGFWKENNINSIKNSRIRKFVMDYVAKKYR